MKKLWLIRKDQEAVSPVIATILMVAITVVLAAVLYVMVSGLLGGGSTTIAKTVGFSQGSSGNNWTLTVTGKSTSGLTYSTVTFKIFDANGVPKWSDTLNDIMAAGAPTYACSGWAANKVCYFQASSSANQLEITVGDKINIDKTTYPSNYKWELLDATAILANGQFQ